LAVDLRSVEVEGLARKIRERFLQLFQHRRQRFFAAQLAEGFIEQAPSDDSFNFYLRVAIRQSSFVDALPSSESDRGASVAIERAIFGGCVLDCSQYREWEQE
jgi:hypothetical protein